MNSASFDKTLWKWINNPSRGLELNPRSLIPPKEQRLWITIFIRNPDGHYRHAEKALLALRLRSLAYRRAGAVRSSALALHDLWDALNSLSPKPTALVASPRDQECEWGTF